MVYCLLAAVRQRLYRLGWLKSGRLKVPVIIIGNITVGGTGKTPLVIWLAHWLRQRGFRPGIITRGYGGGSSHWPRCVGPDTPAAEVGDEAVLLQRRTACPVYAGPGRLEAGRRLLSEQDCDIIISDDGLQHYALERDLELVVIDGKRRLGNGLCLPAGPLRELPGRLRSVDLIVTNGEVAAGEQPMRVVGSEAFSVNRSHLPRLLESFSGQTVQALAGIGDPERFFTMLESVGIRVERHAFPDHHPFTVEDLSPFAGKTVLMTEKDAVKCEAFAGDNVWFVPADAVFAKNFSSQLGLLIDRLNINHG